MGALRVSSTLRKWEPMLVGQTKYFKRANLCFLYSCSRGRFQQWPGINFVWTIHALEMQFQVYYRIPFEWPLNGPSQTWRSGSSWNTIKSYSRSIEFDVRELLSVENRTRETMKDFGPWSNFVTPRIGSWTFFITSKTFNIVLKPD